MILKENKFLLFLSLLILSVFSCQEGKDNQYQIIANTKDKEFFIWFNDSTKDVYNFHPNRKLQYYVYRKNGKMDGQAIYFYTNGSVRSVIKLKKGKKEGVYHKFYPSGNIKRTSHYENDSLRGYYVEYYDSSGLKKAEYMACPSDKESYIYMRIYDSVTQNILSTLDHRHIQLKETPQINPKTLKMPWESDNWYKNPHAGASL